MSTTMFTEMRFWLLIAFSVVLPLGIYAVLLAKRAISRFTVLMLGFALVVIAGVDVNIISHVLVNHLDDAEAQFRRDHPGAG